MRNSGWPGGGDLPRYDRLLGEIEPVHRERVCVEGLDLAKSRAAEEPESLRLPFARIEAHAPIAEKARPLDQRLE